MLKDNHLAARSKSSNARSLREDIEHFRKARLGVRVEIEADTLDQVRDFLQIGGMDIILLDNMTNEQLREAVQLGAGSGILFEASGGVTLETVRAIAETGVDFISVGALTHSAPALDFSLEMEPSDVSR
jgi:nicotinate-nucleotide pyrophosphorylase (carboxylating)